MQITEEFVRRKLSTSQKWVERAIEVLYEAQTRTEQGVWRTLAKNHVGFNKPDAKVLTDYAHIIRRGKHLNPYELADARERMPKYTGQIMKLIQAKQDKVAAVAS